MRERFADLMNCRSGSTICRWTGRNCSSGPLPGREGEEARSVMALDGLITALEVVPGSQLQALWDGCIFGGYDREGMDDRLEAAEERGILALVLGTGGRCGRPF